MSKKKTIYPYDKGEYCAYYGCNGIKGITLHNGTECLFCPHPFINSDGSLNGDVLIAHHDFVSRLPLLEGITYEP